MPGNLTPLHSILLQYLFRAAYSLLYHQMAWSYDWVAAAVSFGNWKTWVHSVVPYLTGPNILELGHGPGHLLLDQIQHGNMIIGLDRSPQMSRQAKKRLARHNLAARLINGKAERLPFAQHTFHQVVATFPSEYIFQADTLAEIYRVLIPNGKLIILPMAWITGKSRVERLISQLLSSADMAFNWEDNLVTPLANVGYETKIHCLELPSSSLMIIEAIKSN